MSKSKPNSVIISFFIKSIVSTVASLLLFTYISSLIIYKLDLSLDKASMFSIIIVAVTSAIIALISVWGLKNNGIIMGIISQLPLILYSLFNVIFNSSGLLYFIIKLAIILTVSALCGYLVTNNRKRYKV